MFAVPAQDIQIAGGQNAMPVLLRNENGQVGNNAVSGAIRKYEVACCQSMRAYKVCVRTHCAYIETASTGAPEAGLTIAAVGVPGQLTTKSLGFASSIDLASIQSTSMRSESLTIAVLYEVLLPTVMVCHGAESISIAGSA